MEPGELATTTVTFLEERDGRALVRLPNGSKTSIAFDALAPLGVSAHLVRGDDATAHCSACDWAVTSESWTVAVEAATEHWHTDHAPA